MIGSPYLAGMLIGIILPFWHDLSTFVLEIGVMHLQIFRIDNITVLIALGWLSRDVLLFLSATFLLIIILMMIRIRSYSRQKKEQEVINRSLSSKADSLSSTNKDVHRFIEVVSHDLRSPLGSISAISELLAIDAAKLSPEQIEEYANNIHNLTMRISSLASNMMDANKIELGEVKLNLISIAPDVTAKEVINTLKFLGDKKSIETRLNIPKNIKMVSADQDALMRVLENLISNAYKFSRKHSTVSISMENLQNQERVKISIKDEGPGFTEEDRKNLYGKFSKLSATPTDGEKTTGLGLYIVQKLVARMDGTLNLESALGEGSVFSVILKEAK